MTSKISIIIPARNEEKFISNCLDSIIANDYSKNDLEILVVDGMSGDWTRDIVKFYANKNHFIRLLENPKKIKAVALNIGIKESWGKYILIMDVHTIYRKNYISKCLTYLEKYKADNVGGIARAVSFKKGIINEAIVLSLSSFFGAGDSYFRKGIQKPTWVDTVFGGCYRREVFEKVGYFNEDLVRSQDMEFNLRLKKAGGKILLVPEIVSCYYPKDNLKDFFLHNLEDGIWAILPFKFTKRPLRLRHYIPLIFVLSLPLSIWPYLPLSLYFSFRIAIKKKNFHYFFVMPIVFAARHIGYGLGSIWGLIKIII